MAEIVPTVVYTATHAVAGSLALDSRMQDKLVNSLTEYIELTDASIHRIAQPGADPTTAPQVATPKGSVELIALDYDERAKMPGSMAKRQPAQGRPGLVITEGIEVRGTVFLGASHQSPAQALAGETSAFFAVTDADLRFTSSPDLNVHTKVALVNIEKVTNLAFI